MIASFYTISLDLTCMDFMFWGYIVSTEYKWNPQTLLNLKVSIKREIANIPHDKLHSVLLSTVFVMQCVITCDDTHVENVSSE